MPCGVWISLLYHHGIKTLYKNKKNRPDGDYFPPAPVEWVVHRSATGPKVKVLGGAPRRYDNVSLLISSARVKASVICV